MKNMKNSGIEWIGEIPVGWDVTLLSALFKERKCKNRGMIETNLLSLSYGSIKRKDITSNEGLLPDSYETYNIIENGNIVFRLTDLQNDKRSLRTGLCKERGIITSAYITLELEQNDNPVYMHYLFHTYDLCKVFYGMGDGVRQGANYEDLKKLRVIRPPSLEQHRISTYLDTKCEKIDSIIARQQEVIEKLKAYKLSVITEAVTKGLNPDVSMKDSGVEWIGEVPEHWEIGKVGYFTTKIGSGKTPKGGAEIYVNDGVLFLRSQNIYDDGLRIEDATYITEEIDNEMINTRVYKNDVLLNITGGSIGRACIYNLEEHANVNQHVCIIRTINDIVIPEFMHYFWISDLGHTSINICQTGANREGMNFEQISKTPIPIMSLMEQSHICNYLDKKCSTIDSAITKKQAIIEKLTAYKKSLIYEVVTGKREV